MAELLASTALAPEQDDDSFYYWTFKDLQARRIIGSRTDLHRKQKFFGFPSPIVLTGGAGASALYRIVDVKAWLVARELAGGRNEAPTLKANSRPRGRPRKIEHTNA